MEHDGISISDAEIASLARYNGEVARGLVHSHQWVTRMEHLQQTFDWITENRPNTITIGSPRTARPTEYAGEC